MCARCSRRTRRARRSATAAATTSARCSRSSVRGRRVLFELGWAVPGWPREYGGRGLTAGQRQIFGEELRRIGRIGSMLTGGLDMLGPTLIQHGSAEQKARFLEPTARGDILWCQLFSEPGAGSDLASLATRAAATATAGA